jgi:BirA family biotin operon repressor/biotin-[acetyl-CoA-carboxylase] ligase
LIGEKIYRFEVIDSTNEYALKNHNILHDGDVVVALEQTFGRGREGRRWFSPKGGLWFTIVFKPLFF